MRRVLATALPLTLLALPLLGQSMIIGSGNATFYTVPGCEINGDEEVMVLNKVGFNLNHGQNMVIQLAYTYASFSTSCVGDVPFEVLLTGPKDHAWGPHDRMIYPVRVTAPNTENVYAPMSNWYVAKDVFIPRVVIGKDGMEFVCWEQPNSANAAPGAKYSTLILNKDQPLMYWVRQTPLLIDLPPTSTTDRLE